MTFATSSLVRTVMIPASLMIYLGVKKAFLRVEAQLDAASEEPSEYDESLKQNLGSSS